MKTNIKTIMLSALLLLTALLTRTQAQNTAPNISYIGVSANYTIGTAITSLTPTNSGGSTVPNYGISPPITTLGSGFSGIYGVAVDAAGNVFFADTYNNAIKKIASDGTITTLGSGFSGPYGVAVDAAGNVFVADTDNYAVKKIALDGTVTTIGSGFYSPSCVAVDAAGNVFVADTGNSAIKKIAINGTITTVGSGFSQPSGVAVDALGDVFVADTVNSAIKKIALNGTITTLGSGFFYPTGVAVDASGNVFVADYANNAVKIIALDGTVATLGSGFSQPYGVAFDALGDVFVADTNHNVVKKMSFTAYRITPTLPTGLSFDGNSGTISGTPIVVTASTVYTVTTQNKFGSNSTTLTFAITNSTLGTNNLNSDNTIKFYPNPATTSINIDLATFNSAKTTLYDLSGRIMKTQTIEKSTATMDISNLAKGVYLLKIETEKGSVTKKIIKE